MKSVQWRYQSALIAMTFLTVNVNALAASGPEYSGLFQWLDRPWEIRYFMWVNDARSIRISSAVAGALDSSPAQANYPALYRHYETLFEPATVLQVAGTKEAIAAVVISFDRTGLVMTRNASPHPLTGRRNHINRLFLTAGDLPDGLPYYFARWFMGIRGDDSNFSPAVCALEDTHRYETGWHADSISGNFGCREWTYQLYNRDRPYIDVTSYQLGGTFIKEFVGWSRFTDPPKPVIGKEGTTWLCLHECPGGASPGIIPDIKAWTRKHGFPMPVPPHKQPMFPNADFEAFQDD